MTNVSKFASVLTLSIFVWRDAVQIPPKLPIISHPFLAFVLCKIPVATDLSLPCLIWKIVHVGSR